MRKDREIINRKIAFNRVKTNLNELLNGEHTFKNIFNISFKKDSYTLFELVSPSGSNKVTYKEAKDNINKYANYFAFNVSNGVHYVGLYLENSPSWIYTFYGLLMAGFSPVLLSTRVDDKEIINIIKKLDLRFIVSNKEFPNVVNFKIEDIDKFIVKEIKVREWADEIVFMTSGVSDDPKLVSFTGKEITSQMSSSLTMFKDNYLFATCYKGMFKHLVILPFYHIFGLIAVFLWFSFFNVTFVFPLDLRPNSIRQACLLTKVSHIFAVPLFWNTIYKEILKEVHKAKKEKKFNRAINLSIKIQKLFPHHGPSFVRNKLFKKYLDKIFGTSISFCISGGGSISSETLRIINGIGYPLSNGYGATEIGITSLENSNNVINRISGCVGFPLGSVKYILNNKDNISSLSVKGDSICNKLMVDDKWISKKDKEINTNDLVIKKDNGYYINGRIDNLFISNNGENYSLENIENKINISFAASYSLIIDKDNNLNLIIAYPKGIISSLIYKDINNLIKDINLSKLIKNIYITNRSIPMSNGIKIKRRQLADDFNNFPDEFKLIDTNKIKDIKEDNTLINDEIINKIIEIFKKQFNTNEIKGSTNFYIDLKGDSLSYFVLVSEIEKIFNCNLNISENIPLTPNDFANVIRKEIGL